jgi:hypothetical protein
LVKRIRRADYLSENKKRFANVTHYTPVNVLGSKQIIRPQSFPKRIEFLFISRCHIPASLSLNCLLTDFASRAVSAFLTAAAILAWLLDCPPFFPMRDNAACNNSCVIRI